MRREAVVLRLDLDERRGEAERAGRGRARVEDVVEALLEPGPPRRRRRGPRVVVGVLRLGLVAPERLLAVVVVAAAAAAPRPSPRADRGREALREGPGRDEPVLDVLRRQGRPGDEVVAEDVRAQQREVREARAAPPQRRDAAERRDGRRAHAQREGLEVFEGHVVAAEGVVDAEERAALGRERGREAGPVQGRERREARLHERLARLVEPRPPEVAGRDLEGVDEGVRRGREERGPEHEGQERQQPPPLVVRAPPALERVVLEAVPLDVDVERRRVGLVVADGHALGLLADDARDGVAAGHVVRRVRRRRAAEAQAREGAVVEAQRAAPPPEVPRRAA